jgi:hypothetical protein
MQENNWRKLGKSVHCKKQFSKTTFELRNYPSNSMDKQQAQDIVRDTFESPFDKGRFIGFVKNLVNSIEDATFSYKGNFIPDAYEQYIGSL